MFAPHLDERVKHKFVFAWHRTGCNPYLVPILETTRKGYVDRLGSGQDVIFQIAKNRDLRWIRADRFDALSICFGLHPNNGVVFKDATQPTTHNSISRK